MEQPSAPAARARTRPQTMKLAAIGAAVIAVSALAWWSFRHSFIAQLDLAMVTPGIVFGSLVLPMLLFTLWIATVALVAVMTHARWMSVVIAGVSALAPFLFFAPTAWIMAASVLLMLVCVFFIHSVDHEARGQVRFSIHRSIRPHLGFTVAIIAIAISFTYYSHTVVSQKRHGLQAIDLLSNSAVNLTQVVLPSLVKEYRADMTLDDFILVNGPSIIETFAPAIPGEAAGTLPSELQALSQEDFLTQFRTAVDKGDIPRDQLPPRVAEELDAGTLTLDDLIAAGSTALLANQVGAVRQQLTAELDITAAGNEPMASVLRKIAERHLGPAIASRERLITPLLAATLAVLLLAFTWLYQIIVNLWASGLTALFRATGFFRIETVQVTQERLTF